MPGELSTVQILRTLWRRRLLLGGIVVLGMASTLLLQRYLPKSWVAQAQVLIEARLDQAADGSGRVDPAPPDSATIDSQVQVLGSRTLARRVIEDLRLERDPAAGEGTMLAGGTVGIAMADAPAPSELTETATTDAFLRRLKVQREGKSNIVAVSYTALDPEIAARAANAIAERYVAEQGSLMRTGRERARQAQAQRVQVLAAELASQQNALVAARERATLGGDVAEPVVGADGERLIEIEREIRTAETELALKQSRLQRLRASGRGPGGAALAGDERAGSMLLTLDAMHASALRHEAELAAQLGERHPKLLDAKAERLQIERRIADAKASVEADLAAETQLVRDRVAELRRALDEVRGTLLTQGQAARETESIARQIEITRRLYEAALARLDALGEPEATGAAGARVISRASIPESPSFPKPHLLLLVGFMVSAATGLVGVSLVESVDRGVRSGEQLRKLLGLTPLGLVPLIGGRDAMGIQPHDYPVERPQSRYAESLRGILTVLALGRRRESGRVVLVTSSLPGEGKSTLALSLARVAAQEGRRVLLIDGDLRRPSLHRLIGREPGTGLAELLADGVRFEGGLPRDPRTQLHFVPGSVKPVNWSALMVDERLHGLLAEARRGFDLVILDTAPVLAVSDSRLLAGMVDQILFVVRWERTPAAIAAHCLEQLGDARSKVAGAVLTQVDLRRHARYGFSDAGLAYTRFEGYYAG